MSEKELATTDSVVEKQLARPVHTMADMQEMAKVFATSGVFGIRDANQVLALMLTAHAEGLHPATAAKKYHIIKGTASMKSQAILADFQAAGGKVEWGVCDDKECNAVFSHPEGGSFHSKWTWAMAERAGLPGANPTWKKYPEAMLTSRCISQGIDKVLPRVKLGLYTPEEIQDINLGNSYLPPADPGKDIDVKVTDTFVDKDTLDKFWKISGEKQYQKYLKEDDLEKLRAGELTMAELTKIATAAQEAQKQAEKVPNCTDMENATGEAEAAEGDKPKAAESKPEDKPEPKADEPMLTPEERKDLQADPAENDMAKKYAPKNDAPDPDDNDAPPDMDDDSGASEFAE